MVCKTLFRKRFSLALAVLLALGCSAQSAPPNKPAAAPNKPATANAQSLNSQANSQSGAGGDSEADMRIKRQIRNSRHLRDDVDIILGARKPSPYGDYDELPVTLSKGEFK